MESLADVRTVDDAENQVDITTVNVIQLDGHVAYETKLLKTDVFCSEGFHCIFLISPLKNDI